MDLYNFPTCEKINFNTVKTPAQWMPLPQSYHCRAGKRTDRLQLSGAVIHQMTNQWNVNTCNLFAHAADGSTAMFEFDKRKWVKAEENTTNHHGKSACVYQWKERNDGNIIVINGAASDTCVSEFDWHKNEWYKLPNTNHCHSRNIRCCHAYVNKDNGLLSIMSVLPLEEKGIVEVWDGRMNQPWQVSDVPGLQSTNLKFIEGNLFCRIVGLHGNS